MGSEGGAGGRWSDDYDTAFKSNRNVGGGRWKERQEMEEKHRKKRKQKMRRITRQKNGIKKVCVKANIEENK